jgi:hypothetical protein
MSNQDEPRQEIEDEAQGPPEQQDPMGYMPNTLPQFAVSVRARQGHVELFIRQLGMTPEFVEQVAGNLQAAAQEAREQQELIRARAAEPHQASGPQVAAASDQVPDEVSG